MISTIKLLIVLTILIVVVPFLASSYRGSIYKAHKEAYIAGCYNVFLELAADQNVPMDQERVLSYCKDQWDFYHTYEHSDK